MFSYNSTWQTRLIKGNTQRFPDGYEQILRARRKDTVHYQYLVVGAGLFGAVFAREMKKAGKNCLVIEKRNHIAGNIYTKEIKNGLCEIELSEEETLECER